MVAPEMIGLIVAVIVTLVVGLIPALGLVARASEVTAAAELTTTAGEVLPR